MDGHYVAREGGRAADDGVGDRAGGGRARGDGKWRGAVGLCGYGCEGEVGRVCVDCGDCGGAGNRADGVRHRDREAGAGIGHGQRRGGVAGGVCARDERAVTEPLVTERRGTGCTHSEGNGLPGSYGLAQRLLGDGGRYLHGKCAAAGCGAARIGYSNRHHRARVGGLRHHGVGDGRRSGDSLAVLCPLIGDRPGAGSGHRELRGLSRGHRLVLDLGGDGGLELTPAAPATVQAKQAKGENEETQQQRQARGDSRIHVKNSEVRRGAAARVATMRQQNKRPRGTVFWTRAEYRSGKWLP